MEYSLVIREAHWRRLRRHLLGDLNEHLAFLLARRVDQRVLVQDLITVPDDDLEEGTRLDGLSLKLPALLEVMNEANRRDMSLVETHSHPFSKDRVEFSPVDLDGQRELAAHVASVSPGRDYSSLVLGQNAVRGKIWLPKHDQPTELSEVTVVGPVLQRWDASGDGSLEAISLPDRSPIFDRQALALGQDGQDKLAASSVGLVGLGGLGSIVAQELAYLGVREFVLVDDDILESSNLNRVVGSSESSLGRRKVELAKEVIRKINPKARVQDVYHNIRDKTAIAAIRSSDVVFGCVDSDAGRLILNELSLAYLVPYIDCGVGISVRDSKISEAGGRVIVWVPERPCLLCCGEINSRIAAEELESTEQLEFRRRHGYIEGATAPEPAVISLNGTVASIAVTEFLALVTGFRESHHYTYYDMLDQRVGPRIVKNNGACTACAIEGIGDLASLDRYARTGLPADLPEL